MSDDKFSRQMEIISPSELLSVTIIGAGHLGSNIAVCLANMGIGEAGSPTVIRVYDKDNVEEANLPASLYGPSHVGMPKVEALSDVVRYMTGTEIEGHNEFYKDQDIDTPIVVLAVDSLEARSKIWEKIKDNDKVKFIVDARSGKSIITIYALENSEEDASKEFVPSFSRFALPLLCSEKAVAFNAMSVAGLVGGLVRSYCVGNPYPHRMMLDHETWIRNER